MTEQPKTLVELIRQRRREWAMEMAREYLRIGELPLSLAIWLTEEDFETLESEMWVPPESKP